MGAIFLKEWRQKNLLFLFSVLMTGFLPMLYLFLTLTVVENWQDQRTLDDCVGLGYLIALFLVVLLSGAGAIAGERETGTLPALLALPLSRLEIWLGKLLASLAMAALGVLALLTTALLVVPQSISGIFWSTIWRDLSVLLTIGFFLSFFWSTVLDRPISALLATAVSEPALYMAAVVFMYLFGASLYGDVMWDTFLWMLAMLPGMVLGSYMTFSRSGLVRGRRRWLIALAWTAAGTLVVGAAIVLPLRWSARYQRSNIANLWVAALPSGGQAVVIGTEAAPVRSPKSNEIEYRSEHAVVEDLATGRELLVRRDAIWAAVSRDGSTAVLLTGSPTLTWRSSRIREGTPSGIEVWDLTHEKRIYRGLPRQLWKTGTYRLDLWGTQLGEALSPDGEWLALAVSRRNWESRTSPQAIPKTGFPPQREALFLLRRDGRVSREVAVYGLPRIGALPYAWDPTPGRHAIYTWGQNGELLRHDLDAGASEVVWEGPLRHGVGKEERLGFGWILPSPDGRVIGVTLCSSKGNVIHGQYFFPDLAVFLVPADSSGKAVAWRAPEHGDPSAPRWAASSNLAWSPDGSAFYLIASLQTEPSGAKKEAQCDTYALRWRRGETSPRVRNLGVPNGGFPHVVLESHLFLVWVRDAWQVLDDQLRLQPLPPRLRAIDKSYIEGVDALGRAIIAGRNKDGKVKHVEAVDLRTGKVTTVFP